MRQRHSKTRPALMAILAGLCAIPFSAMAASGSGDPWQFHVVPYLWLPAVDTNSDVTIPRLRGAESGPVRLNASSTPDDYLGSLNMAFMLMGEARKGPWSIYTDVLYTSFGNEGTKVRSVTGPAGSLSTEIGRKAQTDLSTTVWTLAPGYRAIERDNFELDLMAGARYLTMDSNLKLTFRGADERIIGGREVSLDQDNWDGIVGLRGQILFPGTNWFVPFYADIGTGDSRLTWQALLGAGYRFDWGEVTLAYRALAYEFNNNDADLTLYGPGLGVGFRW